jgi:hypothetical protein
VPLFVLAGVWATRSYLCSRDNKIAVRQSGTSKITHGTRPPCRNLFRDAHFEIIQFVCAVSQFILSLSGQDSFFCLSFHFQFRFQFHFRFLFVFFCGFIFESFLHVESLCQPVLGRLESHMLAPKF